jgi:hypothetical protein
MFSAAFRSVSSFCSLWTVINLDLNLDRGAIMEWPWEQREQREAAAREQAAREQRELREQAAALTAEQVWVATRERREQAAQAQAAREQAAREQREQAR